MKKLCAFLLLFPVISIVSCTTEVTVTPKEELLEKDQRITALEQQVADLQAQILAVDPGTVQTTAPDEPEVPENEIESSVSSWITENIDSFSDTLGSLVSVKIPLAEDLVAGILKKALQKTSNIVLELTSPFYQDGRHEIESSIGFPVEFDIPLLGTKTYLLEIGGTFVFEGTNIVDVQFDTASFKMTEISPSEIYPAQTGHMRMTIIPLGVSGQSHRYRTVLEETSGIEIHMIALTREFVETGYSWTGSRSYILERLGSYIVPANGILEWETSFDLTGAEDYYNEHGEITYREGWFGIDANGEAVGIVFEISTDDF